MTNNCLFRQCLLPILALALASHSNTQADLVGLWDFNNGNNLGQATIGSDLIFEGVAPTYSASLADDSANSLTGVMTTAAASFDNRIRIDHGIAPNGGGQFVNQYSLVMDIFSPVGSRDSWRTIFQTNTGNANDGDYFIRNNTDLIGVGDLGYSTNPINEAAWSRLVLTFDLSKEGNDVTAYIDGALFFQHTANPGVDGRFSLDPFFYVFTDNDGDNAPLNVGVLALFNTELNAGEVAALGGPGSAIPEPASLLVLMGMVFSIGFQRRRVG